jgi:hypothetical protein
VYWIWKTYTSLGLAAFCFWTLVLETSMIGEYTEVSELVKVCSSNMSIAGILRPSRRLSDAYDLNVALMNWNYYPLESGALMHLPVDVIRLVAPTCFTHLVPSTP